MQILILPWQNAAQSRFGCEVVAVGAAFASAISKNRHHWEYDYSPRSRVPGLMGFAYRTAAQTKTKNKNQKKNEKREAISDVAAAVLALLIAISGQWRRRADRHVPKQPHSSASKSTIQSGCFLFRYLKHMHLPCIFPLPASSSLFVCWRSV